MIDKTKLRNNWTKEEIEELLVMISITSSTIHARLEQLIDTVAIETLLI